MRGLAQLFQQFLRQSVMFRYEFAHPNKKQNWLRLPGRSQF